MTTPIKTWRQTYAGHAGNYPRVQLVCDERVACTPDSARLVVLENTKLVRYAVAIGGNSHTAYHAGIPVAFHTTAVTVDELRKRKAVQWRLRKPAAASRSFLVPIVVTSGLQ